MNTVKRIELVKSHTLLSSYTKGLINKVRLPVENFKDGAYITPDMFQALIELDKLVKLNKGNLYITDLFRSWDKQASTRRNYELGLQKAFAAKPGGSFHQAGRAVDFSTSELNFENVPKENWLKKFWDLAIPLGFRPIISIPDLKMSECWHFDFPGKFWLPAYNQAKVSSTDALDYSLVAKCCILDVGAWNPAEDEIKLKTMFIQAQLIRLGFYEIGNVDGVLGAKSKAALQKLGLGTAMLDKAIQELALK